MRYPSSKATAHTMNEPRDLDTLLAIEQQKEKERNGSESAQIAAIRILANNSGALPINDLITRYGVSKNTLAALVDEEMHTDKRRKVRARIGEVDGQGVIWLTASGHQASGKTRGNEVRPTSDSLAHALAPSRLENWIKPLLPSLAEQGVSLSVTWGPSCRAFSERVMAMAWARLKTTSDVSGSLGILTGGLIPDALLVTRRPINSEGELHFQESWGIAPRNVDELAEELTVIEYQTATRQAADPLLSKVNAWSAAIEILGVAQQVIWIVEPKAAQVLASLGVGDPYRRPSQLLVPASSLGFKVEPFETPGPRWWVLDASERL